MRKAKLLESKNCKFKGYYLGKIIPVDINADNFLDLAVPFYFGYIDSNMQYDFNIPSIRTVGEQFSLHLYRDLGVKVDDVIRIGNAYHHVVDMHVSYETHGRNSVAHYFITVK